MLQENSHLLQLSVHKILKGEKFSEKNLWVMRPGTGDYKSMN